MYVLYVLHDLCIDTAGNETVTPKQLLQYLVAQGFELYLDIWEEASLYFGKRPNEILDIDRLFGSKKFNIGPNITLQHVSAKRLLENPIDVNAFDRKTLRDKHATDVIAFEASLAAKMKQRWLVIS